MSETAQRRPPARAGGGNLVIGRREGQSILIGRGIRVTILDIVGRGDVVRVAVEAPKHVAVSRDDVTLEEHMRYQLLREKRED